VLRGAAHGIYWRRGANWVFELKFCSFLETKKRNSNYRRVIRNAHVSNKSATKR